MANSCEEDLAPSSTEALGVHDGSVFVGGEFEIAGAGAGASLARWTPIPEPGVMVMLISGAVLIGGLARRRQRAG